MMSSAPCLQSTAQTSQRCSHVLISQFQDYKMPSSTYVLPAVEHRRISVLINLEVLVHVILRHLWHLLDGYCLDSDSEWSQRTVHAPLLSATTIPV
jgi:hypothetical protein